MAVFMRINIMILAMKGVKTKQFFSLHRQYLDLTVKLCFMIWQCALSTTLKGLTRPLPTEWIFTLEMVFQ